MRTHRKLGLATKLMEATRESNFRTHPALLAPHFVPSEIAERAMVEIYDAKYCSLHVRETNEAAKHLYTVTLQFKCVEHSPLLAAAPAVWA